MAVLCLLPLIFRQELDSRKDENPQGFRPPQGHSAGTALLCLSGHIFKKMQKNGGKHVFLRVQ
jgi:hypothetical protein